MKVRDVIPLIKHQLDRTRSGKDGLTEVDVVEFLKEHFDRNIDAYLDLFGEQGEDVKAVVGHFINDPIYLARALVRILPEFFYSEGFALRFAFYLKLRADLGVVLREGGQASHDPPVAVAMKEMPAAVQRDLAALDRERSFRKLLPEFSRDPDFALLLLEEEISEATDQYRINVLTAVLDSSQKLLDMKFPDFVDNVKGSLFPSFHVRWWLDRTGQAKRKRVLNIGDTGTQKTAFAVVAAHSLGCMKLLVLCPAGARDDGHWEREIAAYFRSAEKSTHTIYRESQIAELASSSAQYVIVSYSTITKPRVLEALKNQPFDGLIWDESHYGKSLVGPSPAARAVACSELINAFDFKCILALSATPWDNHPRELGAVATVLRPDLFPKAQVMQLTRTYEPRLLRELFAEHILEVELREVVDLPEITPKPWEDLFGVEYLEMSDAHRAVYEFVRECDKPLLRSAVKVNRLLLAAIHPHGLEQKYDWPEELRVHFMETSLSTKLKWMKERITRELAEGAKVVVATGIYVGGITRPQDDEDEAWVGFLLKEWFGEEQVLILDGATSQARDSQGMSRRERLKKRWRTDPKARILLVSIRTCPDAINLSVPKMEGVSKLFLTALSFPWVPWKQFLGRFWRQGLGVPFSYAVPVVRGTVDENLLNLVEEKWRILQLFRAQVPLTKAELELFDRGKLTEKLAPDCWSSFQTFNFTSNKARQLGEKQLGDFLIQRNGLSSHAERFARAFLNIQEFAAPGHIARFMRQVISEWQGHDLLLKNRVLDAGCGPLTLERTLNWPVYGVDMNTELIRMGAELSTHKGQNARVGFLTDLPREWQGKFDLTVASLVIDWASLRKRTRAGVTMRLAMLQELVRVTHKVGRVWLTFTRRSFDRELLRSWCSVLERNEHKLVTDMTGLVEAVDHKDRPFAFWSLCFCPEGNLLVDVGKDELALAFDLERGILKRGRGGSERATFDPTRAVKHEHFVVSQAGGGKISTPEAAQNSVQAEITRLEKLGNAPWRAQLEARRRGIEL